ncbi:MAG: hypothetical protein ABFD70_06180 [Syntrophaceae bacterium]
MIEETDDVHEIAGEMGAFERETESVIPQAGSEAKHMRKVLVCDSLLVSDRGLM